MKIVILFSLCALNNFWMNKVSFKPTTANKIYETMSRNQAKLVRTSKLWYPFLRDFWPLVPKCHFWKGDCVLSSASTHFWDFQIFAKIPSLKLFVTYEVTCIQYVFCTRYHVQLYLWWVEPILKSWNVS